ncbi:EAL domain-containing protein [Marinobacter pelagius]|uniref:bifunctional diguanylate cyclase/phosphodiesterase n=1 Tax=Marinobacter sp. C7 TaxID=2951363 RepID=UPI001EEF7C95|nr:EAL domain-containing protein [Marinobacter sp. C7]MCG7199735.1 EAL domain-containing protein [Marinobacter sp. C7]
MPRYQSQAPRSDLPIALPQVVGLVIVLALLHLIARNDYLLFHTLVEMIRIVVLAGLFALAWHTRHWASNSFLGVIGTAAIFVASLELLHTLSYKGIGIFPGDDGNLPTQLWVAFRYLEAVAFLIGIMAVRWHISLIPPFVVFGTATLILATAVFFGMFPDSYLEGAGLTRFKVTSEYIIAGLFAVSMLLLYRQRKRFAPPVLYLIETSLVFNILATLTLTQYVSVYGFANELGHYLLLVSAYLIYRGVLVTGLIRPYQFLFRDLKRHEEHLSELVSERTAQLALSESLTRTFIEHSPALIYLADADGHLTLINPAFRKLVGLPEKQILGRDIFDVFPPAAAATIDRHDHRAREQGQPITVTDVVNFENEPRMFEAVHFPIVDEAGQISGSGAIATDVTDHRRTQANYELMVQAAMDGLLVMDYEANFLQVNRATEEITGYSQSELLTMNLRDLDAEMDSAAVEHSLDQIMAEGSGRLESRWRHKDGSIRDVEISAHVFDGTFTSGFFSFVRDITKRKSNLARIEFLAHFDPLTRLPNRARFEEQVNERLAQAMSDGSRYALVYLDLDNFKDINDSLGHTIGDGLLKEVARRLGTLPPETHIIARASGDEFMVLAKLGPEEKAHVHELDRLHQLFANSFAVDGHNLATSVSMGVALYPADGTDFTSLSRNADTAMYAAKLEGRNTFRRFDTAMQEKAFERQNLLAKLRGALERKEMEVYYQPQMDLASRRITGAEAILRWNNPELEWVSPSRFIPIAEESGLIVEIGEWVLKEACRQGKAWMDLGLPPITLAVNLSAIQFQRGDLCDKVGAILDETGFEGQYLELELTESVLIGNQERVDNTIRGLKQRSIHLAIDDFGTGYSSLAYLNRFAVDKLKIDRSFIHDMGTDPNNSSVVLAIIRMAHSLGLKVIAEGVENTAQMEHLDRLACDEVQGYHLGKPMPAGKFQRLLSRGVTMLPG